jgi:hypothetical protein
VVQKVHRIMEVNHDFLLLKVEVELEDERSLPTARGRRPREKPRRRRPALRLRKRRPRGTEEEVEEVQLLVVEQVLRRRV